MNTTRGASNAGAPDPQPDEIPPSLVEIAVNMNIPIVALKSTEGNEAGIPVPAILFVNEKLLPDCLEAFLKVLERFKTA